MKNLNDLKIKKEELEREINVVRNKATPFLVSGDNRAYNELRKKERKLRKSLELIIIEINNILKNNS